MEKPVFEKGNANWIDEFDSVMEIYNKSVQSSIKMTPKQASRKSNEKKFSSTSKTKDGNENPYVDWEIWFVQHL